jgi:hypothetical protein
MKTVKNSLKIEKRGIWEFEGGIPYSFHDFKGVMIARFFCSEYTKQISIQTQFSQKPDF